MADESSERRLPRTEIERMVDLVRPEWRVRDAALDPDGVTPVYHLVVEGPGGRRKCVLKADRADDHLGVGAVDAEARLLAIVGEHTAVPVPEVLGAVDEADTVRTPFFLMESVPGRKVPWPDVGSLPDATLRRVARQSGRYLGQLHAIETPNVVTYGRGVRCDRSVALAGERPHGDPAQLVHREGYDDWTEQLRDWWAEDLDRLADTRFDDLVPRIRRALHDHLDALPASSPVLARMDHGWHNLLVDGDAGEIEAVLDWGSLCATPPAFDLAIAELYLAGGWWLALPEVPDRRSLVRDAMLSAYRDERALPPALDRQRRCYQLDVLQAWLRSLDGSGGVAGRAIPDDRLDDADVGFRALVGDLLP